MPPNGKITLLDGIYEGKNDIKMAQKKMSRLFAQ